MRISNELKFTIRSATNADAVRMKALVSGVLADLEDIESHYLNSASV